MSDRNACGEIHPAGLTLQEEIAAVMRQAHLDAPFRAPRAAWEALHPAVRDYWLDRAQHVLVIFARRMNEMKAADPGRRAG